MKKNETRHCDFCNTDKPDNEVNLDYSNYSVRDDEETKWICQDC